MRQLNDTVYLVPGDAIYSCNDVGMNAAIVAAEALGGLNGGQVDATGCPGTNTIAATVNVGSSSKKSHSIRRPRHGTIINNERKTVGPFLIARFS